jgi:hypothetical protein
MQTLATVAVILGYVLCLVGAIWLLIEAFKQSILWGLGSLFLPFVSIIFTVVHWQVARRPFFLWLKGFAVILIAVFLLHARLPLMR